LNKYSPIKGSNLSNFLLKLENKHQEIVASHNKETIIKTMNSIHVKFLVAQVIVEELSHLLQRHVTGVNVILAVDVGHAHEIFDALESMMKFARTNGFLGDHVTRIPYCYTTSPVYDLTFQVQIDKTNFI
jgi:hypothetical protein